jgi:hypothetical protein
MDKCDPDTLTTKGWKLLVSWKDGSSSWVPLKDLKDSFPVEVAEYAMVNKILEEPAFAWWAKHVLCKRNRIIKKVKSRLNRTHKYGILLPKSKRLFGLIGKWGLTFGRKPLLEKEMKAIECAFEFKDDDQMPVGHQHIDCHMVFDVKITLD